MIATTTRTAMLAMLGLALLMTPDSAFAIAAGLCPASPTLTCAPATKSSMVLKQDSSGSDSKAIFKWNWVGGGVSVDSFGTPETDSSYVVCVYDGSTLVTGAYIPPSPSWEVHGNGHVYNDSYGDADGIKKISLQTARNGSGLGKLKVKGGGIGVPLPQPPLPFSGVPLTFQLNMMGVDPVTGDPFTICWSATYPPAMQKDTTDKTGVVHKFTGKCNPKAPCQ